MTQAIGIRLQKEMLEKIEKISRKEVEDSSSGVRGCKESRSLS